MNSQVHTSLDASLEGRVFTAAQAGWLSEMRAEHGSNSSGKAILIS